MLQLARYIKDKSTLGLMQAMIVGDEVNMDSETRQAYAETGIIHIVAISGSHITIFFFLISFLLGWIKNKRFQWLKYLLAIPLIWLYVVIAGAPPSAVRAALMFSLLGIGFALQKQHNSLNQLFATAFCLLLVQPYWLFSVGFQLSFLAVLSIVLFYKPIYNLWLPGNRVACALWASIVVSIAAEILVAPLVIYYFHLFPVMFIIANLAAYLFMGVVLVLGMLIIACSSLPPLADFLGTLTHWLVNIFNVLVDFFRKLNPDSFRLLDLKTVELILLYAVILAFGVYIFKKRKPALVMGLVLMAGLLVSFCYNEWQYLHQQKLIVYNISRATHVELFRGKTFTVLATDTASVTKTKEAYTIKPAHIGLHANEQIIETNLNYLQLGSHKVLLLNAPVAEIPNLAVDYLIINYKPSIGDISTIKAAYNPKKLVLGNNIPPRIKKKILVEAAMQQIPVHTVDRDGAFVLDAQ
jgi:competence protein ComEC